MGSPVCFTRCMIAVVAFALCGGPQVLAAQQTEQQPSQPATQNQDLGTSQDSATPDPSRGPQKPVENPLPDSPGSARQNQNTAPAQNKPQEAPAGAAAAGAATTVGGAASKPAGAAIAPAKQPQRRSLVLKIAAIAAAGAAVGIVYGLSRSSPSVPPGANTTTTASAQQR
ncbi:MAG TPA: hypothetical protein VN577_13320 [Terriglobales bacterium]|nr:hypothetical protein [Terriglobales bacterium]